MPKETGRSSPKISRGSKELFLHNGGAEARSENEKSEAHLMHKVSSVNILIRLDSLQWMRMGLRETNSFKCIAFCEC